MNQLEAFFPLFAEMIKLAEDTKALLEGERGGENFKQDLERIIKEFAFFLSQKEGELTPENDEKITRSLDELKTIFEEIVEFFSGALMALNTNQRAIAAYSQRALERF